MILRKKWLMASLVVCLGVILTACGSATPPEPTEVPTPTLDPESPEYNITLSEFSFKPDRIRLRVGQDVTFHVSNHGATDHELMIGRNPLRDDSGVLGDGFEHDFFEGGMPEVVGDATVMGMGDEEMSMDMGDEGDMAMDEEMDMGDEGDMGEGDMEHEMVNGFMAMFEPQQEATITFHVTEEMLGAWTMGCFEVDQSMVHFDEGMIGVLYVMPE